MSIVRIGLAETKNFSEGYDKIFGKKKDEAKAAKAEPKASAKKPAKAPKAKSAKKK